MLSENDVSTATGETTQGGVPTTDQLLHPILQALADGHTREIATVTELVADALELDPAVRAVKIASGSTSLANRVGWARTSLVRAGLVDQPRESAMAITDAGRAALASADGRIDVGYLRAHCPSYATWIADMGGELPDDELTRSDAPTVWLVRAGRGGRYATSFLEQGAIFVGWGKTGDISGLPREAVREAVREHYPGLNGSRASTGTNVAYRVANTMKPGDLILTPEPSTRTLLLGRISGPYAYLEQPLGEDLQHSRPVAWFARASRDELSYGAKNATGTLLTLTRPSHEPELLRLADKHAADQRPGPLPQTVGARQAQQTAPQRVTIPPDVDMPTPTQRGEFQTTPRKMTHLLGELDAGQLALPDFQRSFVWAPDATRELVVSIIRSFPAGALLFLQGGGATFKARAVEQAPDLQVQPAALVLDGQQRLTSLYQAIYGVGQSRFFLDMGALVSGAEVNEAVRVFSADRAAPLESLDAQAQALMMPLSAIRDGGAGRWRDKVVDIRRDDDSSRVRELLRGIDETYIDPLVQYSFPVTVLPPDTELEAVCTIFETLNRTGKPLTPFELISARAFAGGHSLHDYWTSALDEHPVLADYEVEPYYVLQVIALRLGLPCKRSTVLGVPADEIASEWPEAVADMAAALSLLRDECGVLGPKWLPYRPMLIPLAASWREVSGAAGPAGGAMRAKLKRWFWCACFTGEYESSSATLAERDTPVLRAWLTGGQEPPVVSSFTWDPQRWETVTSRQQGLYRATVALTLTQQPRDFHTGVPLTPELIENRRVDDHHVFPRGYLAEIGRASVDSVLNHCLIDRATNVNIGKKAPSVYLAEIREELGAELDAVLQSHMLPSGAESPLATDDFDAFLAWRTERLADGLIERAGALGAGPEPLDPQKAKLDARIEAIELRLRTLTATRLDGDIAAVPDHVASRVRERLAVAERKSPGRAGSGDTLDDQLEYFDLRDLQDVMSAKQTWSRFEETFRTKELLGARFGQLAELRNALRHSRATTEVMIKDGEAALLWFDEALRERSA